MCGQVRMSDLAGLLSLDPSTVSRMVRVLEELGLVARKPDPDDGRATLLDLTESGRAELATARAERHQLLKQALTGWNERDRARLLGLLDRLSTSIRELHTSTAIREVRLS
jgi:DNA-binding MarR family transcriptional regulator